MAFDSSENFRVTSCNASNSLPKCFLDAVSFISWYLFYTSFKKLYVSSTNASKSAANISSQTTSEIAPFTEREDVIFENNPSA